MNLNKFTRYFAPLFGAAFGLAACESELPKGLAFPDGYDDGAHVGDADDNDDPTDNSAAQPGGLAGAEGNTFDHMDGLGADGHKDPFEVLAQRQEEGTPEIRSRLHSCQKPQIAAIGRMLTNFGVDLAKTGNPDTAGELFSKGRDALGEATYAARTGETITWSNSGATKLHDIFVQAASEIIAAMPTLEHCMVDGLGVTMFDASNRCQERAITCLIGRPASKEHVAICNHAVGNATDLERGKIIAVASLLSAAHSCE
ncbi:MAG: hypothetical protein EXR75_13560 [Myxococcales bacterium]|nr:hypothetical protein [Myxococcales bacterium]